MIRLSGRLRSALIIGGQGIRARKLRTLLSMMSLFLGVLAVVVVQAGAETARTAALSDIELNLGKDGTLETYLPSEGKAVPIALEVFKDKPNAVLSYSTTTTIGEPNVIALNPGGSPIEYSGGQSRFEGDGGSYQVVCDNRGCYKTEVGAGQQQSPGQAVDLNLTAMTADIRQFRPFRPVSGEWLNFSDPPSLAPRIVLNKAAAKFFNTYTIPAEMRLTGSTANATPRIIGVIDDGREQPSAYGRMDELLNWVPADQLGGMGGVQILLAPEAMDVVEVLKARLVASGMPFAKDLHVEPIRSRESIEKQLALFRWIFLGMAGLVLLIGVAGILNVGLATVGERIEEFALRRAVGTPRILLAGIVLAETLLTGLFTAAAAIGVAMLGLQFAGGFLGGQHPSLANIAFPWQAGVAGIIAGLIAGILGGLIPAIRAARIPIATVMRA